MSKQLRQLSSSRHAQSLMAIFDPSAPSSQNSSQQEQEEEDKPAVDIQLKSLPESAEDDEDQLDDDQEQKTSRSMLSLYQEQNYATSYLTGHSWDPQRFLRASQQLPRLTSSQINQHQASRKPANIQNTLHGVVLPSMQSLVGVLLFIRLPWILGFAGLWATLLIILMSVTLTILTALSMSAICTNGAISGGGMYFMISRSLGKDFGVSSGLLLYVAISIGSGIYLLGAAEVLVYMIPSLGVSDNNRRLYGTILLLFIVILSALLFRFPVVAVKSTKLSQYGLTLNSLIQYFFISMTVLAVIFIIVGLFSAGRLQYSSELVTPLPASSISSNFNPNYNGSNLRGLVNPEEASFIGLFAIFFPVVTGFIVGSNRSGELNNSSKSIPKGSLIAIISSGFLYVIFAVIFASILTGDLLRTKIPDQGLHFSIVAWPVSEAASVVVFLCGVGQGMQALSGAPKMLQAVIKDDVLPLLRYLKGPHVFYKTLFISYAITQSIVLVGSLDSVAPISTMFYLVCFGFLNMSTALLSLLQHPHWRPTWRYYHWSLSCLGCALSIVYMFLINYIWAIVILAIVVALYYYVEYSGATVEWGSGLYAFNISIAQKRLLILEKSNKHNKVAVNWRPQVMAFVDLDNSGLQAANEYLLPFVAQLRKAGGLTILTTCFEGNLTSFQTRSKINEVNNVVKVLMKTYNITGFAKVLVGADENQAKLLALQSVGIGALKPNSIVLSYVPSENLFKLLVSVVAMDLVLIMVKQRSELAKYPTKEILATSDTIDVYWITHDGGILTLLPYLLKKHRVWRRCQLRIFCIASTEQGPIDKHQIKRDLLALLKKFRIEAISDVIELDEGDMSEFTYERTLKMQQRSALLSDLHTSDKDLFVHPPTMPRNDHIKQRRLLVDKQKVEFMRTSMRLNAIMTSYSAKASLVFCSLPAPTQEQTYSDYFEYVDALTAGLPSVVLVKGSGMEVVTAYF